MIEVILLGWLAIVLVLAFIQRGWDGPNAPAVKFKPKDWEAIERNLERRRQESLEYSRRMGWID